MTFIGTDQTHDIEKALERVRFWLDEGKTVMIKTQIFNGELSREHPHRIEYEVYIER